jgi:hypothetical protein
MRRSVGSRCVGMTGTTSFIRGWALGRSICFVFLTFPGPRICLEGIIVRINRKVVVLIILEAISIRDIVTLRQC